MTSPISAILRPYILNDTMAYERDERVAEATQAILSVIAEAIGPDDPTEIIIEMDTITMGKREKIIQSKTNTIRNALRAEIRQKLGIGGTNQ